MDFTFNYGPFDHGSDTEPAYPGGGDLGKTTIISVGDSNTALEVVAIVDISSENAVIDETVYSEEYWKKYGSALKRAAAIKFTVQHDKDNLIQTRLNELKDTGNPELFRIWFPGTTKTWIVFDGIVTNVRYDAPIGDLVLGTFAVKPIAEMEKY